MGLVGDKRQIKKVENIGCYVFMCIYSSSILIFILYIPSSLIS